MKSRKSNPPIFEKAKEKEFAHSISPAGMRVVKLLVGNKPQTVAQLMDATGVTRTAVTEQLAELVGAGFVRRGTERPSGRGRPCHVYSATDTALLLLFAGSQHLVVPAMWQAIEAVGGAKLTKKILHRVSRTIAEHYRRRITAKAPEKRLRQMVQLLQDEGALVDAEEQNGHVVMRKRSCPFISMLDENRTVCCVDEEMLAKVVERPVRRTTCRLEGDPCCTFEIASTK